MSLTVMPFRRPGGIIALLCALLSGVTASGQEPPVLPPGSFPPVSVPPIAPSGYQPQIGVPALQPAPLLTGVSAGTELQPPAPNLAPTLGAAVNQLPLSSNPGGNSPAVGSSQPQVQEIGNAPALNAKWDNGLIFESPNKDWRFHFGGRLQAESVFWGQPAGLKGTAPGNGGIPGSGKGDGVGSLDDGIFFRRVRLRGDGVAYENFEFVMEVDFEQLNLITYDHLWFGMKDVPFLGTVRVGQQKVPMGMDNIGSDYHLTFLERNVLSEGIWASLFAPGILVANTFFNNNVTFQTMFHRVQPVNQIFTSDFGDGNYADTSRLTWTPLYDDEGAHVIHVGGSYQWRTGDLGRTIQPGATGNTFADTQDVVRFRARPELRDAIGVGAGNNLGGDTSRFVDTGYLLAKSVQTFSPEFLMITGPFSIQSEAAAAVVSNARSVYPSAAFGTARGSPTFWGGYVEASYFLTGEHRGYDRRFGTFDRPKVRENFFMVRGDDGSYHSGLGAWQIAYRYSYLDLNSNGINGGQLIQNTFGVNWYLNDNTKIQFNYNNSNRNVIGPAVSGTVHGFGLLAQFYF